MTRERDLEPGPTAMPPAIPGGRVSAAAQWPALAGFVAAEARLQEAVLARGRVTAGLYEFVRFGLKQGWACLFGGLLLALMLGTRLVWPAHAPVARYDALFLAALVLQVAMLRLRMETWSEARVILVFHVIGTAMEIHKTAIGSWVYPEANLFRLGGVPLFTGFMYAAVGSYLARVWRLFDFRFTRHPSLRLLAVLSVAIYVNFLIDHRGIDLRFGLIAVAVAAFAPATVYFKVWREHRTMPLLLGLLLVALFIWFAENLGTLSGTWLYPNQRQHWSIVPVAKLSSWFLLMIVSYTLVARVNGIATWPAVPAAPARRELPMARATHLGLAAAVIALGLLLRVPHWGLPLAIHHYGGGILWGAMLFLLVAALRPGSWGLRACLIAAFGAAALIESSRLVHTPALDAFRTTLPGQLLLGSIFSPWNLLAYGVGIGAAAALALSLHRERRRAALPA
ncbi:DUF817 family protein [Methylobacterium sp. 13MFTsu3.1M2]|uniref:DUF817 family protein n=1 Tax=Methylobacterium sp. 13MFTsu3.1M2 TaxID=1502776 RepID=UPI000B815C35